MKLFSMILASIIFVMLMLEVESFGWRCGGDSILCAVRTLYDCMYHIFLQKQLEWPSPIKRLEV